MSQARAISHPPPRAKPLTAAMTGCGSLSRAVVSRWPSSANARPSIADFVDISLMSAPATKAFSPAPVRMTAPISSRSASESTTANSSARIALLIALNVDGLSSVTVATRPSTSSCTTPMLRTPLCGAAPAAPPTLVT